MNPLSSHTYRSLLAAALLLVSAASARAQSDAQFSQYYEVPSYYNAGAIGTSDLLHIRAVSRQQWVGIKNAPSSFVIIGDMPFKLINKRFGVGLVMQQESYGLFKNMSVGAQLAYKQKLLKGVLSAGFQIGFVDQSFKGTEVYIPDDDDYHQSNDEAIPQQDIRGNTIDMGLGVLFTHRLFWAGLSCTHLNSPSIRMNAETAGEASTEKNYEFNLGRTFYLMAGSNISIKNTLFEVIPSLMVKTDLTFTTGELTGRVRYNKFLTAGVGYRYRDAIIGIVSAEFKGFFLGYSFDYPTSSALASAAKGSHEIMAGYSMKLDFSDKNKNKHKSIRIM